MKGAFLCGNFQNKNHIYIKVLEVFEKHYHQDLVLKLLCNIYGLKQAATAFSKEWSAASNDMRYKHSPADSCLLLLL